MPRCFHVSKPPSRAFSHAVYLDWTWVNGAMIEYVWVWTFRRAIADEKIVNYLDTSAAESTS